MRFLRKETVNYPTMHSSIERLFELLRLVYIKVLTIHQITHIKISFSNDQSMESSLGIFFIDVEFYYNDQLYKVRLAISKEETEIPDQSWLNYVQLKSESLYNQIIKVISN